MATLGGVRHRRHLNQQQKRELVAKLLVATPDVSNRQIAEAAKVSHPTVAAVRDELEATGKIDQLGSVEPFAWVSAGAGGNTRGGERCAPGTRRVHVRGEITGTCRGLSQTLYRTEPKTTRPSGDPPGGALRLG